jgi:hypothetical protein
MSYCLYTDVQQHFQQITLSATSKPTINDATEFCDLITIDMDVKLEAYGVTLPVTDADKLDMLKLININGAIAMMLRAVEIEPETAKAYQKLYDDALAQIERTPGIIQSSSCANSPGYKERCNPHRYNRNYPKW